MSRLLLETEALESAASSISSLQSSMSGLSGTASGWDTSDGDAEGFNFSGVKSQIASNIDACASKFASASKILEAVIEQHTSLQNSMKFNDPGNGEEKTFRPMNQKTSSGSRAYSSGGGGGSYSSGGGGSYVSGGRLSSPAKSKKLKSIASTLTAATIPTKEDTKKETNIPDYLVKNKTIKDVGCVYIAEDKQTEESKMFFSSEKIKYNDNYYAMYDDKYVIACDDSVGKVGDVIKITRKDNSSIECIIGVNSNGKENVDNINFVIDKNAKDEAAIDKVFESIPLEKDHISKLENFGSLDNYEKIKATVSTDAAQDKTITSTTINDTPEVDNESAVTPIEHKTTATVDANNSGTTETNSSSDNTSLQAGTVSDTTTTSTESTDASSNSNNDSTIKEEK